MVVVRMSATSGMVRSSAIWQNGSTLITPPDKASKRLFETSSSKKSGARLSASITASRPPAPRRGEHLRRLDRQAGRQATARGPRLQAKGLRRGKLEKPHPRLLATRRDR